MLAHNFLEIIGYQIHTYYDRKYWARRDNVVLRPILRGRRSTHRVLHSGRTTVIKGEAGRRSIRRENYNAESPLCAKELRTRLHGRAQRLCDATKISPHGCITLACDFLFPHFSSFPTRLENFALVLFLRLQKVKQDEKEILQKVKIKITYLYLNHLSSIFF